MEPEGALMQSLADAFVKNGLVTEEEARRATIGISLEREAKEAVQRKKALKAHAVTLEDLESATTIRSFRDIAKKLLSERPVDIKRAITLAQRFQKEKGGKRLLWILHSVDEKIESISPTERESFLRRAFRNHGATLELPSEEEVSE